MADQVEVPKIVQHIYTAPPADHAVVSKLVMYVWALPGDSGGGSGAPSGQGTIHAQILRRS